MTSLSCDILIIGSGAAGGVLAGTLSELTNKKVILLEKGGWFGSSFFDQREWDMRVLYADEGRRSTVDGSIAIRGGECVGGGTTVNYMLCFDPIESVWKRWRDTHGLTGFSFDPSASDYGIAGLNMSSALQQVRARLNVHPASDEEINDNNRLLQRGCSVLGIPTRHFELNLRNCVRSGFCGEGCAYDAKQGTLITYVPDALSRGVRLVHHCDVDGVIFDKRKGALTATGVNARVRRTRPGSMENSVPAGDLHIDARLVIVSAGAIGTPELLQRSNHPDPNHRIGRGLVIHPSLPVIGVMETPMENYRGIPGTIYSDAFSASHHFYLECLFGQPVYGSVVVPGSGPDHFEVLKEYSRLGGFGIMLVDQVDDANRVEWHVAQGTSRIHYQLTSGDQERLRFAAARAVEVMFAGGATEVILTSEEMPRFKRPSDASQCAKLRFEPYRTTITSAHAQATVKMSEDVKLAVTSSRGESHSARNLIVCDSSSFPTSCGANPMLSIMTMARYQGRRIAAELARYEM
jgi:choline dehydrogenase-like flavoprotein